jgi:hypothetical protein
MKNLAALALGLGTLALLALACGRYGSPRRPEPASAPAQDVPVTDPGVPR